MLVLLLCGCPCCLVGDHSDWAPLSHWFQGHFSAEPLFATALVTIGFLTSLGLALAPLWERSALSATETLLTCQNDVGLGRACHLMSYSSWVPPPSASCEALEGSGTRAQAPIYQKLAIRPLRS